MRTERVFEEKSAQPAPDHPTLFGKAWVIDGDTLVINNAANAGSISMRAGGTVMTLMPPKTPAGEGLLDIAV